MAADPLYCFPTSHPIVVEARRSRVRVPFEETGVWVVSIEGLIALKRLRTSPLDLLDIEALEALRDQGRDTLPGKEDA